MAIANSRMGGMQQSGTRPSAGAFLSYGFRPFFLGAAVYAVVLMSVWLVWVASLAAGGAGDWLPVAGSPYAWHAHELVFGFAAAAIAGFLLTAVPNWTGALPLSGRPLALLFGVWLAGRCTMALSGVLPSVVSGAADIAFLPLLGAFAARQLFVKPAARNLVFLFLIAVMTFANAAYHLSAHGYMAADPLAGPRAALLIVALMIAIIGGRIVPSFTHNYLHLNAPGSALPVRNEKLDIASVVSVALFALVTTAGADPRVIGFTALAATVLNGIRLYLWRGWSTRREPIVWVLHAGYAWLVVALAVSAASELTSTVPASLAYHAFGTGAASTMILAVMTRASLGHTGRPLEAPRAVVWSYLLVTVAGVLRVIGPIAAPAYTAAVVTAAALAWIAAFALFVVVYAPILTTPRPQPKARGA